MLFREILDFYQINDFKNQIINYEEFYRNSLSEKLPAKDFIQENLDKGFYIGEEKCHLGEFLSYSAIPRYIKRKYPESKITVCPNIFSEAVFRHNPYVDQIAFLPERKPTGAWREFGFGNQSQRRLRAFSIYEKLPVKPEIHVSKIENEKALHWRESLKLSGRKLMLVHSSGKTVGKIMKKKDWKSLFKSLENEYCFVQIGSPKDQKIPAEYQQLRFFDLENLAAMFCIADGFLGPNSGLMHVAAATNLPSIILHNEASPAEFYLPVLADNLVLPGKANHHLWHVYPWHYHLVLTKLTDKSPFMSHYSRNNLTEMINNLKTYPENPLWKPLEKHFLD